MRPPPPPRTCSLQRAQDPTDLREEATAGSLPPRVSKPSPVTQELPRSNELRRKRDFNLFAWALTIAGCVLIVLVLIARILSLRHELGRERQQLLVEYEAQKRELVTEYEAKKRHNDAQTRQLQITMASLERRAEQLRQRELSGLDKDGREARDRLTEKCDLVKKRGFGLIWKDPLIGEPLIDEPDEYAFEKFEYRLDNKSVDETEVRGYFELSYTARCARGVLSRHAATHRSNEASAVPVHSASIFEPVRSFTALSSADLHEAKRLGSNWRDNVDWKSQVENFGTTSEPGSVEEDR